MNHFRFTILCFFGLGGVFSAYYGVTGQGAVGSRSASLWVAFGCALGFILVAAAPYLWQFCRPLPKRQKRQPGLDSYVFDWSRGRRNELKVK